MVEITAVLGNIGEFIGAIAVVVTLVYLSIQIRHSRELIEWSRPFNEAGSPDIVRAIDGALAIADMGVADSPLLRQARE